MATNKISSRWAYRQVQVGVLTLRRIAVIPKHAFHGAVRALNRPIVVVREHDSGSKISTPIREERASPHDCAGVAHHAYPAALNRPTFLRQPERCSAARLPLYG